MKKLWVVSEGPTPAQDIHAQADRQMYIYTYILLNVN